MNLRRPLAVAAACVALALTAGCQSPIATMVTPPGWGNETAGTEAPATAPTLEQLRAAAAPALCGAPAGTLVDGALSPALGAAPIGGGTTAPVASSIRIATDPGTGAPLVALAADDQGAVGAAAIFECVIDGVVTRDRVVVWDTQLRPLGAIELATLRGTGPVVGTAVSLGPVTARVSFTELGDGNLDAPAGQTMKVPLTVESGRLAVGAITVG